MMVEVYWISTNELRKQTEKLYQSCFFHENILILNTFMFIKVSLQHAGWFQMLKKLAIVALKDFYDRKQE